MGKMREYMGEVVGNDAAPLLTGALRPLSYPCFILICAAAGHSPGPEDE